MVRRLAIFYAGGAAGAVANGVAVWLVAAAGVLTAIGVSIAPAFTWTWLSHRMLWGGLWGLALASVPRRVLGGGSLVRSALLFSLVPSAAQLFYFSPVRGAGWLGLELGLPTPLVVMAANGIWGWTLARVCIASGES